MTFLKNNNIYAKIYFRNYVLTDKAGVEIMGIFFCYLAIYFIIFVFGACIGSFLNVCILRLPSDESLIRGASHCMTCGEKIKKRDLIPILSWCLLKGKCRSCKAQISPRYTVVEVLNAMFYVIIFAIFGFVQQPFLPAIICLLFSCLIVVFFMDLDTQTINTGVLIAMALLGIARYFLVGDLTWQSQLIGAFCISIPFLIIVIASRERAMGLGDALLMFSAGLLLGVKAIIIATFIGLISGSVAGLIQKHHTGSNKFAFGPWLSIGIAIGAIWGAQLADLYLKLSGLS